MHHTPLEELRAATRDIHRQLDSVLPVAGPEASLSDYIDYLCDLRGWLITFEGRLWNTPWPAEMEAESRRGKLAWIESDLRTLGIGGRRLSAMPQCSYAPDLSSQAACFGLAYVVEGAQLGVQSLKRSLSAHGELDTSRWLHGYGRDTARRWKAFIHCTEKYLDTEEKKNEAALAARAAFASLADWFARRQHERRPPAKKNGRSSWTEHH